MTGAIPLATLALALGLSAGGSSGHSTGRRTPASTRSHTALGVSTDPWSFGVSTATRASTAIRARHPLPGARARRSPGTLPQTHAYPSGTSPRFRALMRALWRGVVDDSLTPAVEAFFPQSAYVQLKAIPSAGADWTGRLLHDFRLDVEAAHALLGADAHAAELLRVNVPSGYGHWIEPGTCYNAIGYYEAPNARVVFREHGRVRSFGIASLISWRGVWYVVHLGAILRSTDTGTVDEPADGPGISAYSGTC